MKPLVIAHRGDSRNAPENTLASFKRALEMGADGIELDVQLTKDGQLVVIHDERVDRTTDGIGFVKDFTLKELKRLDAGIKFDKKFAGERIPTLYEVFELIGHKNFIINIEIKSGVVLYPGIEEKLIKAIEDYDFEDRVVISSFNHYSLRDVKRMAPEFKIGLLYQCGLVEPWHMAIRMKAYSLHPFYFNIIPELVKGCKKNNIKLFPWTVDRKEDMEMMIKAGVDAIITDDPQTLINLLEKGE
ncbi:glycerophosphoryl diester phosphodiesterase [Thermoanaerobacter thermohydrosulfuricus]|uniref:Glycerophosphoryl diester phosphodiesterase n=2 Tax=Thermoanaerobacter thermohydrosulfuricus TaxID=1516 RepID=M8CUQ7_THETY|nr:MULTISPECIES: glycerophosphodiester phosphodiesterase [Thermoanaerobacter]EMT38159.1 Glycerophosphoryl diester phosphodiesterase [Thermoanaerobacter thermohydrosulfuricus WC1]UZQ83971.1 glycerophosphodiester phosphodiesterase [Thermoanaerobacter sp. RKWS2]SDG62488.1 glycerophosphoryl diester phosphodiesterase [Thermoanaerobacter thermohydrosulfuricus]SFE74822.1 glycerophosphoryl diester phosphodiesterase [Thermoanaerobacter thermohydrosulfuricus]